MRRKIKIYLFILALALVSISCELICYEHMDGRCILW